MNESFDDDKKLKAFMQRYQPQPPPAGPGELNQLLSRTGLLTKPKVRPAWLAYGSAIAASLAMVVWVATHHQEPANTTVVSSPAPEVSEEIDLATEELPTLDVGEDYLVLAGGG